MSNSSRRISRYAPLAIWAALIFIGSSSILSASHTAAVLQPVIWLFPHTSGATLKLIQLVIRKAGHLTEYASLALLAARAFRTSSTEILGTRWFWISLALVIAYSLSDEFHQSFVASRTASIYDSLIDTIGGTAALVGLKLRSRLTPLPRLPLNDVAASDVIEPAT